LTADIAIAAVSGFEYSLNGSTYSSTLTLPRSGGAVASTTVSIRLAAGATGSPSGITFVSSSGATTRGISVSGIVGVPAAPTTPTATSARDNAANQDDQDFMQTRRDAAARPATPAASPARPAQSGAPVSSTPPARPFSTDGQGTNSITQNIAARVNSRPAPSSDSGERDPGTGELISTAKDLSTLAGSSSSANRPAPAGARPAASASSAPRPAATPAAAPEPASKQMFQAAQDRASRGENDTAAFFAADKQMQRERGMMKESVESTIRKIIQK
jgi:hypothetical protein